MARDFAIALKKSQTCPMVEILNFLSDGKLKRDGQL